MVSVPVTTRGSVEVQPLGKERLRYAAPRNAVGPALGGMGRAMSRAANDWDEIEATYDEAAAKEIDNNFTSAMRERLHTADDAFFKQQGRNAVSAQKATEDWLRKQQEEHLARAQTPRQRNMLERALRQRVEGALLDISEYGEKETRVYEDQQAVARIEQHTEDAVLNWSDPAKLAVNLGVVENEILHRADKKGWDAEYTQGQIQKAKGNVYASIVKSISIDDPMAAQRYLDEHRAEIGDPDIIFQLENMVDGPALEQWADEEAEAYRGTVTPTDDPNTPTETFSGSETIARPVKGAVSSSYGWRKDPITGERKFHRGRDIPAPEGTPVGASATGRVVFAGEKGGYGNYVVVDHGNGRKTAYAHLSAIGVREGQKVDRGAILGKVGSTGRSTGPHLHWEMYVDGKPVDPETGGQIEVAGAGARGGTEQGDLEAQVSAVEAGDYTFRQKKALIAALTRKEDMDRQFKARREEEAYDDATRTVLALDEGFTSVSQLGESYLRMSPQQQMTFKKLADRNAAPKPPETDLSTYWALAQMEAMEPREFARLDPFKYATRLSREDLKGLIARQKTVLKESGALTPKAVERSRLFSVAKDAMQISGIDTSDTKDAREPENIAKRLKFIDEMQAFADVWAQANPGKVPPDAQIRQWAGTLLLQVDPDGKRMYEFGREEVSKRIPRLAREQAIAALRRARQPITEDNIRTVYLRALAIRGPAR